jgi:tripartite-type tricarboxylate transporter receptor subunit TctC
MAFVAIAAAAPHISSGKLRAIGVSTAARSPLLSDVPTLTEQGIQGFDFEAWIALIGPAGLPADVVARLYEAVKTALATPQVQDGLRRQGFMPVGSPPKEAAPFFASELAKHAQLAKEAGLRLE